MATTERKSELVNRPPLSSVIPPLILGTATFNIQYVTDPSRMPYAEIVSRALGSGIAAFDTSPYYGPSEILLGEALAMATAAKSVARDSYFLITKAGRIASSEFDYSPRWVRYSVCRSLERLRTSYLDLVYMHDVEFVSPQEVLVAVRELRSLRDNGLLRYVGISGYPVDILCSLAELVLRETGEPLDAVMSYSNFCVQNARLGRDDVIARFMAAGVCVVPNASMLSMGLLTTRGADRGPMSSWHPAPDKLRVACRSLADIAGRAHWKLEELAIRWALRNWAAVGASLGSSIRDAAHGMPGIGVGVSVMGVSSADELVETCAVWASVLNELGPEANQSKDGLAVDSIVREEMWPALGRWRDYTWPSPGEGFINLRTEIGELPDDEVARKYATIIG